MCIHGPLSGSFASLPGGGDLIYIGKSFVLSPQLPEETPTYIDITYHFVSCKTGVVTQSLVPYAVIYIVAQFERVM